MARIHDGRFTARPDGCGAVFLIGMRVNRPWRPDKWLPVFTAMPKMLRHLGQHPEYGMLGMHSWFGRTTILVSYWRDAEDIVAFAAAKDAPHRAAWQRFNRATAGSGDVGVWHETYVVQPGSVEAVYSGMPRFGLGAATEHVAVDSSTTSARKRMARQASAARRRSRGRTRRGR